MADRLSSGVTDAERTAELRANLAEVRARIDAAATAAGRDPAEITLIAITKTFPASDAAAMAGLGVTDLGENRDQEAGRKAAETSALLPPGVAAPRWHFVGQLQRNKARSVAAYADVVQSVDRPALVDALAAGARRAGRELDVLVQVSLDPPDSAGRAGVPPDDVVAVGDLVEAADGLRLAGVMAVAPLGGEPDPAFARLAEVADRLRAAHPGAGVISAGMSGDLESAIAHGASWVRVGTALFGRRGLLSDHVR